MKMREIIQNRKILYILLALLVAVAIWIFVDMFGNNGSYFSKEITITEVPITYTGEDDLADRGLMLVDEGTTATVDVTLSGARTTLARIGREDLRVTADLTDVVGAGGQTIALDVAFLDSDFPNTLIESRSPSRATVNISELYSKTVDIICDVVGNVADGYSAGELQLSQDTLEIRGQQEDVDQVSYVQVTLDIGEDAMETVSQSLEFSYYDENNQLLDSTGMHPTVDTVEATLPVFVIKELDLVVDFVESAGARASNLEWHIFPETITVSGDAGLLRDVDSITLGQLNLLDLLGSGTNRHAFPIIIPEGCENLSGVTRATLTVEFVDMSRAQVSTQNFRYENLPDGKQAEILTQQMTVSIFGTASDVAAVTGGDVTVVADLSNYSGASGTYTVPATIEVDTAGDVGVSGTYNIQVTITDEAGGSTDEPPDPDTP